MCGILFRCSLKPLKAPFSLNWSEDDAGKIDRDYIQPDLAPTLELSEADKRKLANLEAFRALTKQLAAAKNNVKISAEEKRLRIENIETKMRDMEGQEIKEIESELETRGTTETTETTETKELETKELETKELETKELETNLLKRDSEYSTRLSREPSENSFDESVFYSLVNPVACRGPDYLGYETFEHDGFNFLLLSSVLSLRTFQSQPLNTSNYAVQFNGELYNEQCLELSDAHYIMEQLEANGNVLQTVAALEGEFAFVIVDKREKAVYFGRDRIGKRALSYELDKDLTISSLSWDRSIDCANKVYRWEFGSDIVEEKSEGYERESQVGTERKESERKESERNGSERNGSERNGSERKGSESQGKEHHSIHESEENLHETNPYLPQLYHTLKSSTHVRQKTIFPLHEAEAHLGVLFSGGLDCTIVAGLLCENILEFPAKSQTNIDLLTVGFDNPRTQQSSVDSPDRKLAHGSWKELATRYNRPGVLSVRLVEVDVPYEQWLAHRKRVLQLIAPHDTEMDLSIAIAFYFASSRLPSLTSMTTLNGDRLEHYDSNAKVLFSGLGADELFAGYSRHESIFANLTEDSDNVTVSNCYDRLRAELHHDITVIHTRNLSRDDRAIACWGKEVRYPYLDEKVIALAESIPPELKLCYEFRRIVSKKNKEGVVRMIPERKHLLRELAGSMGLNWVRDEPKRAIQFGAKSAKLEVGQSKTKGTEKHRR